jgi:hypothetical protein
MSGRAGSPRPEIDFLGFLPLWREQLGGRVAARFVSSVWLLTSSGRLFHWLFRCAANRETAEDDDHGAGNRLHIA